MRTARHQYSDAHDKGVVAIEREAYKKLPDAACRKCQIHDHRASDHPDNRWAKIRDDGQQRRLKR